MLRMRDRIAQLLEKIADRVGHGKRPAADKPDYQQRPHKVLEKMIHHEWALCTTLCSVQIPGHSVALTLTME